MIDIYNNYIKDIYNDLIISKKENIMVDLSIRKKWELFVNEYKEYFLLNQKHSTKKNRRFKCLKV